MSRDNERSRSKGMDPAILAAIITVIGGIFIALIPTLMNMFTPQPTPIPIPTWTPIPTSTITDTPVPTDTVPPGDPSSTPAPATSTPEPSPTLAAPPIGEDWANDCISVLWKPYPAPAGQTDTGRCLPEPVNNSFFVDNGSLKFLIDNRFENTEQYGMFAPLPPNGTASIQVSLRRLQDAEIWMGVFAAPDMNSQGMIIVIPPGDVQNRLLVQKTMPGQIDVQKTQPFSPPSATYDVAFEFGNGAVKATIMRDTVFDPLPVISSQQWLFVGYQVKRGNNRIDAEFLNLVVQEQ